MAHAVAQSKQQLIELFILAMMMAVNVTFFVTFLVAYLNGMTIIIHIERFGEAHIELVLFSITLIAGIMLFIKKYRELS
jgi:hypothetical protein